MAGSDVSRSAPLYVVGLILAVTGCTELQQSPDSGYRQALETALINGRCEGATVRRLWSAYDRWYAVGSSISGHDRIDEAEALMRQGRQFRILGCLEVARASYTALLRRFPGDEYAAWRDDALMALRSMPQPTPQGPVPDGPVPIRPDATAL